MTAQARAAEAVYFKKEDERLLRQLLNKVKTQADALDNPRADEMAQREKSELESILSKYKVGEEDIQGRLFPVNWCPSGKAICISQHVENNCSCPLRV